MADGSQRAKGAVPAGRQVAPAFQHTVMFWVLAAAAGMLFVPCAVLPVYAEYATWREHRARLQARIQALHAQADRNEAVIDALRTDPAVNARLLARDLGYVEPDQEVGTVLPPLQAEWRGRLLAGPAEDAAANSSHAGAPAALQPWEAHIEQRLPSTGLMAVFTDRASRRVLLIMSGTLLAVALVAYPHRARST